MIQVGTICYLTGDHARAGQCCTVTGPAGYSLTNAHDVPVFVYPIVLATGEACGAQFFQWAAEPRELIPIAPPGLTQEIDTLNAERRANVVWHFGEFGRRVVA